MFKDRIKNLRKQKGWTSEELAEKAGVSTGSVYKAESGKGDLSETTIRKLSAAFEVPYQDLYKPAENSGNRKLMDKLKHVYLLTDKEREVLETLLDSFLLRKRIEKVLIEENVNI